MGEFGGLGLQIPGHTWKQEGNWGYQGLIVDRQALLNKYTGLMKTLRGLIDEGLSAGVYTQTTDVEIEINGLLTYDRRVLKFNPEVLRAAHRRVAEAATR